MAPARPFGALPWVALRYARLGAGLTPWAVPGYMLMCWMVGLDFSFLELILHAIRLLIAICEQVEPAVSRETASR